MFCGVGFVLGVRGDRLGFWFWRVLRDIGLYFEDEFIFVYGR